MTVNNFKLLWAGILLFGVGVATENQPAFAETLGDQEYLASLENAPSTASTPKMSDRAADVSLVGGPVVWREDEPATSNSLWGKRIVTEAGHGRIWYNNAWRWQREDWFPGAHVHSSQEDFNTARMVNRWLLPYLRSAGAQAYPDRCPDEQTEEIICDVAGFAAPHTSTGTWTNETAPGSYNGSSSYAIATDATSPTATAQIRATIAKSGYYGVTIWYPLLSESTNDVQYVVVDGAGNRHPFRVDQTRDTSQWVWLDRFYFEAGTDVPVVEVTNLSRQPGLRFALDCVRLGGGMGSESFGGGPSGLPRWQECAKPWTKYVGAPSSVYGAGLTDGHDYSTRFNYAAWQNAELFMRLHTNGSVNHTGFGSEVYQFAADNAQLVRAGYVYPKIINSIRTNYKPSWTSRGVKANTVVPSRPFPQVMVELGFHDWLTDAEAMMDADFRRAAMRGYYEGAVDYFTNKTGVYMPEPPEQLAVINKGGGMVRAQWTTATMGGSPDAYRVYYSTHPHCYKDYAETSAPLTSVAIGPLDPGEVYYFQFRAINAGGLSLPSETLSAMTPASADAKKVVLVNGFDRFDWDIDETDNHRNYCKEQATAVADAATSVGVAISIDSASNEAIAEGTHTLAGYAIVNWMLGQESVRDETFSAAEQAVVTAYRLSPGVLVVSGTDVALDLGTNGSTEDQAFLNTQLGASPLIRLSNPSRVDAAVSGVFAGLNLELDDSGSIYNVLAADAVNKADWATAAYYYSSGLAAVQSIDQPRPLFYFTFPLETVSGADSRRAMMERILPFAPENSAIAQWHFY